MQQLKIEMETQELLCCFIMNYEIGQNYFYYKRILKKTCKVWIFKIDFKGVSKNWKQNVSLRNGNFYSMSRYKTVFETQICLKELFFLNQKKKKL